MSTERTPEQVAQDSKDRRALVRAGMPVANPMAARFTGAVCGCGEVIRLDGRSWIHLSTGTVECS